MRFRLSLLPVLLCIITVGCSKIGGNDLAGTRWTGEFISSEFEDDERNELSFKFYEGKGDFTYLKYAEQYPEEGVLLYASTESSVTFSKANEDLNGEWRITSQKGKHMTLTRQDGPTTLTINLIKRQ